MKRKYLAALAATALGATLFGLPAVSQETPATSPAMSFFVTSVGLGNGGDLGGLEGADAHCQELAAAVGAGGLEWKAYLSTQGEGAVNARDRIGTGPWYNAAGVLIASSLEELHAEMNNVNAMTALTESGTIVPGRENRPAGVPNMHDILTGSQRDGTAFPADVGDRTCSNWTASMGGAAWVGHTDLMGNPAGINYWNYSHATPGCAQPDLARVGGAGLLYCFATGPMMASTEVEMPTPPSP